MLYVLNLLNEIQFINLWSIMIYNLLVRFIVSDVPAPLLKLVSTLSSQSPPTQPHLQANLALVILLFSRFCLPSPHQIACYWFGRGGGHTLWYSVITLTFMFRGLTMPGNVRNIGFWALTGPWRSYFPPPFFWPHLAVLRVFGKNHVKCWRLNSS